ncbi:hypothetical protein K438DRAFT_1927996 [Mycena galopus ATCC 62051]|nr:hypothetical protein K438DRAFT_1927996 [Mycena galopus ATCC 62051]
MDSEPPPDNSFPQPSIPAYSNSTFGSIFAGSHDFSVCGGTFTTTNNYLTAPSLPSDFRMIPLGDIKLLREIWVQPHPGTIDRRAGRHGVRRVYSAKIAGRKSVLTVATYQGDGSEQQWQRDLVTYASVRNPAIVQLYGAAASNNIHATIFHDELIPLEGFLDHYRHSHILTVYIYAHCNIAFEGMRDYFYSAFRHWLFHDECTLWIRRSTGRLCVDLVPGSTMLSWRTYSHEISRHQGLHSMVAQNSVAMAIDSLTLDQYHEISYWEQAQRHSTSILPPMTVKLGTVVACSGGHRLKDLTEIAFLPSVDQDYVPHWNMSGQEVATLRGDGWVRYHISLTPHDVSSDPVECHSFSAGDIVDTKIQLWTFGCAEYWLSQANYVFHSLRISHGCQDYVVLNAISFELTISATTQNPPEGFLFLSPASDFQTDPWTFRWPDHPAYWSLDESGTERLSMVDAADLGFPCIFLGIQIQGLSWDDIVYAGIHQFQQAKGFDADTQDAARCRGRPLYELSSNVKIPINSVHNDVETFVGGGLTRTLDAENPVMRTPQESEHLMIPDGRPVPWIFKFLMHIQLVLILFLALFGLYTETTTRALHDALPPESPMSVAAAMAVG